MSLTEFLQQNRAGKARFYMPGHKGALPLDARDDITEITGADSLYEASGLLREAERRTAAVYGAKETIYSAGGATLCIQAMLAAASRRYRFRKIAVARNCHISFVNACALLNLDPVWIFPDTQHYVSGQITPQQLEQCLQQNPDVGAVYVTSPDYFGVCSDVAGLAEVCRTNGIPLLVDNAHGAHLHLYGRHPLQQGAALCCDSAHKSLPVLTGGAFLHANDGTTASELKEAMALFGSTSPSYLILQSLEQATEYLQTLAQADFDELARRMDQLRTLARETGVFVYDSEPTKLSLCGIPCHEKETLAEYFHAHGIEYDYAAGDAVVLMASPFNTEEEFTCLEQALRGLRAKKSPVVDSLPQPKRRMALREAVFAASEEVPVGDELVGRVAAQTSVQCPPGVAAVVPGEEFGPEHIRFLKNTGIFRTKVVL